MKIVFEDKSIEELYTFGKTKDRKYVKYCRDHKFMEKLANQINLIKSANGYEDLLKIAPLHYERLRHKTLQLSSFRVMQGRVERVLCREHKEYIELTILEINDTHYGNKR